MSEQLWDLDVEPGAVNLPAPIAPVIDSPSNDSDMPVVTVVGTPSSSIPWWVWLALGVGAYWLWSQWGEE